MRKKLDHIHKEKGENLHLRQQLEQLAYKNTNIRFMMNLLFTHCIYIEITGIGHLSEKIFFSGGHLSENYFSFT
jgi:hypothetical protein